MSAIQRLRENDPARTDICIWLCDESSDADLAQALQQNPYVRELELNVHGEEQTDWSSLLPLIATRANLEKVELCDAFDPGERNAPALVGSFLHAIQQNTAIRNVVLSWLRLPTDISMFVDNASSITSFRLHSCDMEAAVRGQGARRRLAAALQRNTNIETLELDNLEDIYAVPILEGLRLNTAVKSFTFTTSSNTNISDEASHALQQLLESTTSIQRFSLEYDSSHMLGKGPFQPIAQAITNSETVSELKLLQCHFEDRGSLAQLQSILQNKQNLTSLCLRACEFGGGQIHEDMISVISRPGSLLRCFEFWGYGSLEALFPRIQFQNLLEAVQTSKLERFKIGSIKTPHQLQTLTQSIPSMHIRELDVVF